MTGSVGRESFPCPRRVVLLQLPLTLRDWRSGSFQRELGPERLVLQVVQLELGREE